MDPGSTRIRLYSRLAAIGLAAVVIAGVLAFRVRRVEEHFGSLTIISYIEDETPVRREARPQKPSPQRQPQSVAAAFIGQPSSDEPPRLWTYNAFGQIVFDRAEQYRRCLEARAAHHNEADCPDPHDTHSLILRPG